MSRRISGAMETVGSHKFSQTFLLAERGHIVDAWQIRSWEDIAISWVSDGGSFLVAVTIS